MIRRKCNLVETVDFRLGYIIRWVGKTSLIQAMQTFPGSFKTEHFVHLSHVQTVRDLELKRDELKYNDFKLANVVKCYSTCLMLDQIK